MAPLLLACARLLAAACDDAARMTVAPFAAARFAGLSNIMAPAAYFFDFMQLNLVWAINATQVRLARTRLAAVWCRTLHAAAFSAVLLQPSVRQYAASAMPRLDGLLFILPALASASESTPLLAAWSVSPPEKPRVAAAHVEEMAVGARTAMRAAWRVRCVASEERERRGHCGYGQAPFPLNIFSVCR